jgi:hypothetical protein
MPSPTAALQTAQQNLTRVKDILSFHGKSTTPAKGPPLTKDTSLVLGATALTYAVWENYIEQLALAAVAHQAAVIDPGSVPASARKALAGYADAWDLAGDGWRSKWNELIESRALGDG